MTPLWVPPSDTEQVNFRCACGAEFQSVAKGQRHAIGCARRNGDEFGPVAMQRQEDFAPLDSEMWTWGRRRMKEGKVGFKRGRAA